MTTTKTMNDIEKKNLEAKKRSEGKVSQFQKSNPVVEDTTSVQADAIDISNFEEVIEPIAVPNQPEPQYQMIQQNNITINHNIIIVNDKKICKNKTYYLEEDVILNVKIMAQQNGMSEAKFVNQVLKQLFIRKGEAK